VRHLERLEIEWDSYIAEEWTSQGFGNVKQRRGGVGVIVVVVLVLDRGPSGGDCQGDSGEENHVVSQFSRLSDQTDQQINVEQRSGKRGP
jgi:hypothetical protein